MQPCEVFQAADERLRLGVQLPGPYKRLLGADALREPQRSARLLLSAARPTQAQMTARKQRGGQRLPTGKRKAAKDARGAESQYLAKILRTHWVRTLLINGYAAVFLVWAVHTFR